MSECGAILTYIAAIHTQFSGAVMSDEVRVEVYDQIVEITIDRPPANAINPGVSNAIYEALSMLQEDDNRRVGIITGCGE